MGSLALIYFLAVQPLVSLFADQADRLSQARTTLSNYRAIADREETVRALEPTNEANVRYLKAHLELAGPVAAIYATLRAIEGREPYLFVGQALLRMPAGAPGVLPTQEPSIEAQLDIHGPVRSHAAAR